MDPNDHLRLIANPFRLNKKEIHQPKDNVNDLLMKYLKLRYKIYIHSDLLVDIDVVIDDAINDYLIKKTSHEFVDKCIRNVLQKFENQID
jgi:hypothetical protein